MLRYLLRELFRCDWQYLDIAPDIPLPDKTRLAMSTLLSNLQSTPARILATISTWRRIEGELEMLGEGYPIGTREEWLSCLRELPRLQRQDPLAGIVAGFYALAVWESGRLRDGLDDDQFGPAGQRSVLLALLNALVEGDALWTARAGINAAINKLQDLSVSEFDTMLPALEELRILWARLEARLDGHVRELAWDLRKACLMEPMDPVPEVAAVAWALGDPYHAAAVARGMSPRLSVLRRLVRGSLDCIEYDPCVQYIWLRLKDREPFDLRRHAVLCARFNSIFTGRPFHEFDELIELTLGRPASEIFARAVTEHFGRDVSGKVREELDFACQQAKVMLVRKDAGAAIRMWCLWNLVEGAEITESQSQFRTLCSISADALGEMERQGRQAQYDRSFDLPYAYLAQQTGESLAMQLEELRFSALWFPMTMNSLVAGMTAVSDVQEAREIRNELAGLRLMQLRIFWPTTYRGVEDVLKYADDVAALSSEQEGITEAELYGRVQQLKDVVYAPAGATDPGEADVFGPTSVEVFTRWLLQRNPRDLSGT